MNYKVLSEKDYKLTTWSGGDTNELYIYPENSEYKERNFLFRISSATVEQEKSTFTKLNGVSRKLMPLTGELRLSFRGKYEKKLDKFDIESFLGDWDTTSYGKVTDFNLMTKAGCTGELEHIKVLKKDYNLLDLEYENQKMHKEFFYSLGGNVQIIIKDDVISLKNREMLMLNLQESDFSISVKILNNNEKDVDLIKVKVCID